MENKKQSAIEKIKKQAYDFIEERNPDALAEERVPIHRIVLHFIVVVIKNFVRNRCLPRAAGLAYTTLLGLVPLLAVAIGVSTSLLQKQGEEPIRQMVDKLVAYAAPALDLEVKKDGVEMSGKRREVVAKITEFVSNIHSGTLGATGVIALIFIAVSLLRNVETAINDIWGVARARNIVNAIVQYWSVITLGPLIFIVAIGLTSSVYIKYTSEFITMLGPVGRLIIFLLPFGILSFAFAVFYQLMPNTRVQWRAALVGGIVGGTLWQLNSMFNTLYINKVVTYSKIYGSLGMLPVFLIGLYFSWVILLLGAQVAYVYQNRKAYIQEKMSETVNERGREFVALRIMVQIARAFEQGYGPQKINVIANALGVPFQLTSRVLSTLASEGLLVTTFAGENAYLPSRPLEKITIYDVIKAIRCGNGRELETTNDVIRPFVRFYFDKISAAEKCVADKTTLKELAAIDPTSKESLQILSLTPEPVSK
ncbi:MAG: YihY family inner membrane protein [Verrucomicrobiae bacterium]|nr:YihY family inner membrane protein [Verrucomicrobiae bacterium]